MNWISGHGKLFHSPAREIELRREIDIEFRFHIERKAADLENEGFGAEEALRRARIAFGDAARHRHACLVVRRSGGIFDFVREFGTLLPRIVGSALVLSVLFLVWSVVIRVPVMFPSGDGWVLVGSREGSSFESNSSWSTVQAVEGMTDLFGQTTAARYREVALDTPLLHPGKDGPLRIRIKEVSPNYFDAYRVRPEVGQLFAPGFEKHGALPPVVLGYDFWSSKLKGDREIAGDTVRIDGRTFVVSGVAPESFRMYLDTDIFVPLGMTAEPVEAGAPFLLSARIRGDVLWATAERELANWNLSMQRIQDVYSGPVRGELMALLLLAGIGALALWLASETAPWRQWNFEMAMLTGTCVVLLTTALIRIWPQVFMVGYARLFDLGFERGALIGSVFIVVGWVLLLRFGIPLRVFFGWNSMRGWGLVIQAALTIGLLAASLSSLSAQLDREDTSAGFDRSVRAISMFNGQLRTTRNQELGAVFKRLEASAQVDAASLTSRLPGDVDGAERRTVRSAGRTLGSAVVQRVGTDYFGVMRIGLESGVGFETIPPEKRATVAIVNRAFADRIGNGAHVLGREFDLVDYPRPFKVVAITEDHVPSGSVTNNVPTVYLWYWVYSSSDAWIVIRSEHADQAARAAVSAPYSAGPTEHGGILLSTSVPSDQMLTDAVKTGRRKTEALLLLAIVVLASTMIGIRREIQRRATRGLREAGLRFMFGAGYLQVAFRLSAPLLLRLGIGLAAGCLLVVAVVPGVPGDPYLLPGGTPSWLPEAVFLLMVVSILCAIAPIRQVLKTAPVTLVQYG